MKLVKTASDIRIRMSKSEWESIGKTAGWNDHTEEQRYQYEDDDGNLRWEDTGDMVEPIEMTPEWTVLEGICGGKSGLEEVLRMLGLTMEDAKHRVNATIVKFDKLDREGTPQW
jgi:hypothetical protein